MLDATRSMARLPRLARLVMLAALAALGGAALGAGLATLGNEPAPRAAEVATTSERAASTTGRTTARTTARTTGRTTASAAGSLPRVAILSAVLHPAAGLSGQARQRARLSVGVNVTNRSDRTITLRRPELVAGATVRVDPNAAAAAAGLLRPIAARSSARGVLRFETAGAVTERLTSTQRATLRIGNRTVALRIRIGNRAAPTQ